jgi:acyl-coenzyme A thioesterase PaaI-like protein
LDIFFSIILEMLKSRSLSGSVRRFTTVELRVNFRPVTEGRLLARSRLVRVGSTICVGQVDLSDHQRRDVGVAIVTYMLLHLPKVS